jgi:hypothetical protein
MRTVVSPSEECWALAQWWTESMRIFAPEIEYFGRQNPTEESWKKGYYKGHFRSANRPGWIGPEDIYVQGGSPGGELM